MKIKKYSNYYTNFFRSVLGGSCAILAINSCDFENANSNDHENLKGNVTKEEIGQIYEDCIGKLKDDVKILSDKTLLDEKILSDKTLLDAFVEISTVLTAEKTKEICEAVFRESLRQSSTNETLDYKKFKDLVKEKTDLEFKIVFGIKEYKNKCKPLWELTDCVSLYDKIGQSLAKEIVGSKQSFNMVDKIKLLIEREDTNSSMEIKSKLSEFFDNIMAIQNSLKEIKTLSEESTGQIGEIKNLIDKEIPAILDGVEESKKQTLISMVNQCKLIISQIDETATKTSGKIEDLKTQMSANSEQLQIKVATSLDEIARCLKLLNELQDVMRSLGQNMNKQDASQQDKLKKILSRTTLLDKEVRAIFDEITGKKMVVQSSKKSKSSSSQVNSNEVHKAK